MDNIFFLVIIAMVGVFLLILLVILLQIHTRNKILVQQKQMAEADMQHKEQLMHVFITSQEAERKRIGMDLHDEVGSALSALRIFTAQAPYRDGPDADTYRTQNKAVIDTIIQNVRSISHNLSPFIKGAYGLMEALLDICDRTNKSGTITAILDHTNIEDLSFLSDDTALALYR